MILRGFFLLIAISLLLQTWLTGALAASEASAALAASKATAASASQLHIYVGIYAGINVGVWVGEFCA